MLGITSLKKADNIPDNISEVTYSRPHRGEQSHQEAGWCFAKHSTYSKYVVQQQP